MNLIDLKCALCPLPSQPASSTSSVMRRFLPKKSVSGAVYFLQEHLHFLSFHSSLVLPASLHVSVVELSLFGHSLLFFHLFRSCPLLSGCPLPRPMVKSCKLPSWIQSMKKRCRKKMGQKKWTTLIESWKEFWPLWVVTIAYLTLSKEVCFRGGESIKRILRVSLRVSGSNFQK